MGFKIFLGLLSIVQFLSVARAFVLPRGQIPGHCKVIATSSEWFGPPGSGLDVRSFEPDGKCVPKSNCELDLKVAVPGHCNDKISHNICCVFITCGKWPRPRGRVINKDQPCNHGHHWENDGQTYVAGRTDVGCCINESPECEEDEYDSCPSNELFACCEPKQPNPQNHRVSMNKEVGEQLALDNGDASEGADVDYPLILGESFPATEEETSPLANVNDQILDGNSPTAEDF